MQEYWTVPADRLLKVPDSITDDHAPLVEPLAVAVHDTTRAEVKAGDAVVVFGGGPIGSLIALVSRHRGARVLVSEINPYRVELLNALGLETIGPGQDVQAAVRDWTDGAGADIAFEVSGDPAAARLVTEVVRVWGTASIIAIHAEPVPIRLYSMFARELRMHGSRLYTRGAWEEAIRLAASGAIDVAPLVSRVIPLDALQSGMAEALGGGRVMKVLVNVEG
jgi:threonine dehydrogenase-like Zn-dependent dehydrogenase